MPLFGRAAKQDLTVTVAPPRLLPGGNVEVRVEVAGDGDSKARALTAGIRCINRYTIETTDSDGDTSKETKSVYLHDTVAPLAEGPSSGVVTFTANIPATAAPSAGHIVEWHAYVNIDRARGKDTAQQATFQVASASDARVEPTVAPDVEDACPITFEGLPTRVYAAGQTIQATLTATPQSNITAKSVQVVLEAIRMSRNGRATVLERVQKAVVDVAGKTELAAGVPTSWPLSMQVPADAIPNLDTEHTLVFWRLNANVARGGLHKDIHGRLILNVYTEVH